MATLIANASADFTGASTWALAATGTGSSQTTIINSTASTTSYVYSPTFTITNGEVLDGVLIYIARSNSSTGTFSVALSDDNGVTATREVTVNITDLVAVSPAGVANLGWYFFKFGSTLTADGGTDYRIGVKSSSSGTVTIYRSATTADWAHIIRTTAAATAAAADNLYLCGEFVGAGSITTITVTMNQTAATDYGTLDIGASGVLTWGTTAATNYILQLSGNLNVWAGGTYNQGTVATPVPRDSTATLQFDCAADGDFGLIINGAGTCVLQGLSRTSGKNIDRCLLNTDEAVNSTSLGVDTDTGWLDNDRIAVASTTRTATQCETGTLNGNAGSSTLTVDGFAGAGGGLAFAHSGTSPTQAEVILLTRNVVVRSVSTTAMAYVHVAAHGNLNADWVEFRYLGTNTTQKRGVELATTTGTVTLDYCSICDTEAGGLYLTGSSLTGTLTVTNLVLWNVSNTTSIASISVSATTGVPVLTNILLIYQSTITAAVSISDAGLTLNGLVLVGVGGNALTLSDTGATIGSISNITIHSGSNAGLASTSATGTISNLTVWRQNGTGINLNSAAADLVFDGMVLFGNSSPNITLTSGRYTILNLVSNGDSTFSTANGMSVSSNYDLTLISPDFSTASGIKTAHTNDISVSAPAIGDLTIINGKLGAATEVATQTNMTSNAIITSQKHDQTAENHKYWKMGGTGQTDSTIKRGTKPSERLTPNSTANKMKSGTRRVPVSSGQAVTISSDVRKSTSGDGAAYTGAQPRLILKRNDAVGVTSDTVIDTMTASTGSWETLTGTTGTVTDDGVLEFYVDCDGTAGWSNVDNWAASVA